MSYKTPARFDRLNLMICAIMIFLAAIQGFPQNNPFASPGQTQEASLTQESTTDVTASPFGSTPQGSQASPFGGAPATAASPFGGAPAAGAAPFGAAQPSAGVQPAPPSGIASIPPFGATTQGAQASPFGGAPATAASPFGGAPAAGAAPFGAAQPSAGVQPAPPSGMASVPPFGATTQDAQASPFGGAPATGASPFGGDTDVGAPPFGAAQPSAGVQPASPSGMASVLPMGTTESATQITGISSQASLTGAKRDKEQPFSEGMPPLNVMGSAGSIASQTTKLSENYYENLEDGKNAIKSFNKPGMVFLTNPKDEDNQRIERILGLPQFRGVLNGVVFIKLDVDKEPRMLSHYGIYKTPSVVFYDSSGLMRKKIQSVSDMNHLYKEIENLVTF